MDDARMPGAMENSLKAKPREQNRQISWRLCQANRPRRHEPDDDPPRVAHERLAFQERQTRNLRQLHADARRGRGAVSRHHRLRRHGHPRNQPGPDRPARHALPGREGPGQEPADAAAGRGFSTKRCPISTSPAAPCTRIPTSRSPRWASGCWPKCPTAEVPIAWWPREQRYAERLAPGTKFADIIGEIDPAEAGRAARACRPKRPCTSA